MERSVSMDLLLMALIVASVAIVIVGSVAVFALSK
jgi:hypothetical protein